jgi:hypothetical protein
MHLTLPLSAFIPQPLYLCLYTSAFIPQPLYLSLYTSQPLYLSAFIPQVSQDRHPTYSLPMQGKTGHQAALSQVPLATDFIPRLPAVSQQVPPITSVVPPYHGAFYQVPPCSNVNAGPQEVPCQAPPMTSTMHCLPPPLSTIPVNQDASQQASTSQLKDILGELTLRNIEIGVKNSPVR